ncbi:hypothetical protein Prum_092900 [Phytohabitans rumicis]|uniref:Uncharacterized protein n=1 Tax=Phytohabitans rumicis TaxID=1076125 RepID=A0A6V8LLA2_9ACTN|nr:hypothetical protein Prum_092900 [Phytohabitans rumicis]
MVIVWAARMEPPTALARELPTLRKRVLRPLADASSERGAARMTRPGIAAYAMPVPAPAMVVNRMTCHRWSVKTMRAPNPTAMTSEPAISAVRGRSFAENGDSASIARPPGSMHRPPTRIDLPKP